MKTLKEMLAEARLLSKEDLELIRDGLSALGAAHARGEWRIPLEQEDGQTALEMRLTERIGEAGARIHLGRSRNDQILVAIRLYLRDVVAEISAAADAVADALVALAEKQGCDLPELKLEDMQRIEKRITKDVYKVLTVEASVASRTSFGGTAPANVTREARRWLKLLR